MILELHCPEFFRCYLSQCAWQQMLNGLHILVSSSFHYEMKIKICRQDVILFQDEFSYFTICFPLSLAGEGRLHGIEFQTLMNKNGRFSFKNRSLFRNRSHSYDLGKIWQFSTQHLQLMSSLYCNNNCLYSVYKVLEHFLFMERAKMCFFWKSKPITVFSSISRPCDFWTEIQIIWVKPLQQPSPPPLGLPGIGKSHISQTWL